MDAVVGEQELPVAAAQREAERHDEAADAREAAVSLNVAGPGVSDAIVRLTNAISKRLEEGLEKEDVGASRKAEVKQQYDYIAAQVSREDGLIHNRMTWTLQLNGFLFAALALMKLSPSGEGRNVEIVAPWLVEFLLGALPLAGLGITVSGWLGVRGAIGQLKYLCREYVRNVQSHAIENKWPRPFGGRWVFWFGTAPAHLSLATLCFLWSWLGAHRVWPDPVEKYSELFLHALRDLPARMGN